MAPASAGEQGRHPRVRLGGVEIDAVSEAETIETVLSGLARGRGGWICPVNLDVLRRLAGSSDLRDLVGAADLVVADGAPLLWANRIAGGPRLPERVAGSTLVTTLTAGCAKADRTVFMLGGSPGAAEGAAARLRAEHPTLRVLGTLCPPMGFERDPDQLAAIEERLRSLAPDVVYVALGFPKQDHLALGLRRVLPGAWFLSCGISLSFVAGDVTRAPRWVQVLGLEWLHRLAQEPRRLARRYLVEDPPFLVGLMARAAWAGARRRLTGPETD
jgi:N-acetylglucosaminyldiphosphoundecaprenol N-acetyl-beta-D-mannosaminyltransferase